MPKLANDPSSVVVCLLILSCDSSSHGEAIDPSKSGSLANRLAIAPILKHNGRPISCSWERELRGQFYGGPVVKSEYGVQSLYHCATDCVQTPGCRSVNFLAWQSQCILMYEAVGHAIQGNGWTYQMLFLEASIYLDGITCQGLQVFAPTRGAQPNNIQPWSQQQQQQPQTFQQPFSCGVPLPPFPGGSFRTAQKRIIGGRESKTANAWPWQIGLFQRGRLICGGTLIRPDTVVTAAHCVLENAPFIGTIAIAGAQRLYDRGSDVEIRTVVKPIMHPRYTYQTGDNDIALLKLDRPVTLGFGRQVICLPDGLSLQPVVGSHCVITGWGTFFEAPAAPLSPQLREASVQILSQDLCNDGEHYRRMLTENMFCAGSVLGGVDACQGDSGGPLACKSPAGYWILAGVISWGNGCASAKYPGIYTKVSNYLSWMRAYL